ncbi:MAG: hypothetical protein ACO3N9_13710 [Alphaproteobacteria bacterium]
MGSDKKITNLITIITLCLFSGPAIADLSIENELSRIPADKKSGSGHSVLELCPNAQSTKGWPDAKANLHLEQSGSASRLKIVVEAAVPDTLFTVWLRLAGSSPGNEVGEDKRIGPNPMNGGGATALVHSKYLDQTLLQSPPFPGTENAKNSFKTNMNGSAVFVANLDFPILGGAYPFQRASTAAVMNLREAGSKWPLVRTPAPIVNPSEPSIKAPFLLRIVSHCQDNLAHGLSPSKREPWFQWDGSLQ